MKKTIILTKTELNKILAKHFKVEIKDITYAGWSGMLDFGQFLVSIEKH